MYLLRTFGTLSLGRDGSPVELSGTQRKALALLTVLATDGVTSRDRLMALLWPDSDMVRARGSLKQVVHHLRHQLQEPDLLLGRADLTLNTMLVRSDVGEFRRALEKRDPAAAVEIYRGPFLEAIHLNGGGPLEDWAADRRNELARAFATALEECALEAEARGDLRGAIDRWRQLQAHDPLDGRTAHRLMEALAQSGQHAAALQHARVHEDLIRSELDLAPDPAIVALAGRLRQSGPSPVSASPRLIPSSGLGAASVTAAVGATTSAAEPTTGAASASTGAAIPARSWMGIRDLPLVIAALGVILLAVVAGRRSRNPTVAASADANLVAVAPFEVVDPALALWHEGLADIVAYDLDGAGNLRTVPPSVSLRQWSGRADRPSAERFGGRTRAGLVVYGSVRRWRRDSISIRVALLDRTTGIAEPDVEVIGGEQQMGELADSVSVRLLRSLGERRPIASTRHVSIGSRSLPALKAFLQGEQLYRRGLWDSALVRYDRAFTEDTTFALAARRMVYTLGSGPPTSGRYRPVSFYSQRALAMNHGLAPRDSIMLDADAFSSYAPSIGSADLLATQLFRSMRSLEELARRYPEDPAIWYELAEHRVHGQPPVAGFAQPALHALSRAIALDPEFAPAYAHAVELALRAGRPDLAAEYARAYGRVRSPDSDAEALSLLTAIFGPGGIHGAPAQRLMHAATSRSLFVAGAYLLSWYADSSETTIVLLRELVDAPHESRGSVTSADDPLVWRQRLAAALAFRGHLREAARTDTLLDHPEATRFTRLNDSFDELAQFGLIPEASVRRTYALAFASDSLWVGPIVTGSGLSDPPRILRGLPWWFARGDSASIARFGARASAIARIAIAPIAMLRARYYAAAAPAYLALLRGDTVQAIRRLDAIPDTLCLAGGCRPEKLALARVLAGRGDDRRAAKILDEWTRAGGARTPQPSTVLAELERARIAERLGDRATALARYRFVADTWRHADPELQYVVVEATDAIRRLAVGGGAGR